MRRLASAVVVAVFAVAAFVLAGCSAAAPAADRGPADAALPKASELPGRGWSVVGTTTSRPGDDPAGGDALTAAATGGCRTALDALHAAEPEPDRFARAVYRRSTATGATSAPQERDLTLTVETLPSPPDRAARVSAATAACAEPVRTRAGAEPVTMRLTPSRYTTPGTTGYAVTFDSQGLTESFDYAVLTRGDDLVSASVTGPDGPANRRLLDQVVAQAAARFASG